MSRRLDVGAGAHSDYEYQIDQVKFEKTTDVLDVSVDKLPYESDFFDEVRLSQVLEHIPVVIYWKEDGKFKKRYCRVELMRECFRVLKREGMLKVSTPTDWPYWAQDPTHCDTPVLPDTMEYFCGGWGANDPNDFANKAYGIDFAFKWAYRGQEGFNMNIMLIKP